MIHIFWSSLKSELKPTTVCFSLSGIPPPTLHKCCSIFRQTICFFENCCGVWGSFLTPFSVTYKDSVWTSEFKTKNPIPKEAYGKCFQQLQYVFISEIIKSCFINVFQKHKGFQLVRTFSYLKTLPSKPGSQDRKIL